jgi:hypothetical protein
MQQKNHFTGIANEERVLWFQTFQGAAGSETVRATTLNTFESMPPGPDDAMTTPLLKTLSRTSKTLPQIVQRRFKSCMTMYQTSSRI